MSGIDIASNSALLSVADKLDMQNVFLAAIAGKENGLPINDWGSVQAIVRAGLAPKVFAVGDQLSCNHETYGELVWDIIGFDHDTPTDKNLTHSMTLMLHNVLNKNEFDAFEPLFCAEEELLAGTYSFSLPKGYEPNYGGSADGETTYSFTLKNPVPKGGCLLLNWQYGINIKSAVIKVISADNAEIETVSIVDALEGATELKNIGNGVNHISRTRYGSNAYKNSAIRKWLNSNKAAGNWWSASNVFDRAPEYVKEAGFLNGLDKDFMAVIGKTQKTAYDDFFKNGKKTVTLNDYMFLASADEVYSGVYSPSEGTVYDYYKNYSDNKAPSNGTDNNRVKYYDAVAVQWNLRSPGFTSYDGVGTDNCTVRSVFEDGSCTKINYATGVTRGVVPACCII